MDYRHPDFCNEDGTTRILKYWDQSVKGNPPKGYYIGTEYTKEQIDEALFLTEEEGRRLVPGEEMPAAMGLQFSELLPEMEGDLKELTRG